MKLIILKEKLKEGVTVVEKISQKSLTLPVLQNVLLTTKKNSLELSTTNLESGIIWRDLAKTEKEGSLCVPVKFFLNLLSFLPEKPITLETKDSSLVLSCENYTTKIKGISADEFPIIPQSFNEAVVKIENTVFCEALSHLINIPSTSSVRPEISGVFFVFEGNLLKLVATDSFRLAEKKITVKTKIDKKYSLIIPQAAAKEIVSIFGEKDGDLFIYLTPNQAMFEHKQGGSNKPHVQFISRLIEGEYPNYEEIIPKKYETEIKFFKKELLNQVKAASLFSGKINEVKLEIDPKKNKIDVFSQSSDVGEYKGSLKADIKGNPLSISFNHRFLIDGLNEIKENETVFNLTSEEGPACLKPLLKEESYLYIIMPIKAS